MPAKLNIPDSNGRSTKYEKTISPQSQPERRMPTRAASEARSPPQRSYSRTEPARSRGSRNDDDSYPDDVYDMYSGGGSNGGGGRRSQGSRKNQPRYIEEEEEASDYDSFNEGEFEMVSASNRRPGTSTTGSIRSGSRRPDVRNVKVKVHASEDVRSFLVGAAIEYPDLVDKIRDKFGMRKRFKIKVRDDDAPQSEMITMGDQDDLDLVMMGVKTTARKKREEMGKLEVSFFFHSLHPHIRIHTRFYSFLFFYFFASIIKLLSDY